MNKNTNKSSITFDPIQQGVVKRHPDGFGFFVPDNSYVPDVYISRQSMGSVMTNDRVEVLIVPEPGGKRFRGSIKKILERKTKTVVGRIFDLGDHTHLLRDESLAWGSDLSVVKTIEDPINEGDWVEVEILTYPDSREGFTGQVTHHIGDSVDPMTDNKRVLVMHNIPHVFSSEVHQQAQNFPETVLDHEKKDRKNLVHKPFITIDGQTAKDFDDAILVEKTDQGFILSVAIADVSHYVKPKSPIDKEAYNRGTSTYFPNFVSPMLPEVLSNELCSLKPNVDRLALVAEMRIHFSGTLESYEFYEAVIKSHARVTYGEAQDIIDGHNVEKLHQVQDKILLANDLAKILMAHRFQQGSLELDVPETIVELDETGQPVDIIKSERLFAHRLIEEMMLVANIAVAKFLFNKDLPALYRIHDEPNELSIELLKNYLAAKGIFIPSGGSLQKRLTNALQQFVGKPEATIINILTLRSMSQAQYSPHNIGHFGLGFEHYAHFTSPIRRYPDLIIHRLIKSVICPKKGYQAPSLEDLETAGTMLSASEQRSVKAERFIDSIKKARFMSQHIGEEFSGIISSVTKFGVFVALRQFNVDGLVRIEELANEALMFDEENLRLVGRRSGMAYNIGDEIKIQIAQCNIDLGQIDFVLAEGEKKRVMSSVSEEDRPRALFRKKSKHSKKSKSKKEKKYLETRKKGKSKSSSKGSENTPGKRNKKKLSGKKKSK